MNDYILAHRSDVRWGTDIDSPAMEKGYICDLYKLGFIDVSLETFWMFDLTVTITKDGKEYVEMLELL